MVLLVSELLPPEKSTIVTGQPGGWNSARANHFLNGELLEKLIEISDFTHLGSQLTFVKLTSNLFSSS